MTNEWMELGFDVLQHALDLDGDLARDVGSGCLVGVLEQLEHLLHALVGAGALTIRRPCFWISLDKRQKSGRNRKGNALTKPKETGTPKAADRVVIQSISTS